MSCTFQVILMSVKLLLTFKFMFVQPNPEF